MAAFCACCGAEIGPKAEACPACGAPQHGMAPQSEKGISAIAEQGYPAVVESVDDAEAAGAKPRCGACVGN